MKLKYIEPKAYYKCMKCDERNIVCDGCKLQILMADEFLCINRIEEKEASEIIHLHNDKECIYKYFKNNITKLKSTGLFSKIFG